MIKKIILTITLLLFCGFCIFSQAAGTVEEEVSAGAELLQKKAAQSQQTEPSSEKKIALIMGNSGRKETGMSKYVMDALSMSALLAENDFQVKVTLEGTQKQLLDSLKEYSRNIKGADSSFLYFAGEMTSFDNVYYLIPVGSEIADYDELTYKAVALDDIFATVAKAGCKKNLFIFDVGFVNINGDSSSIIPERISLKNYKMESYVAISATEADKNNSIKGQHTPFTGSFMTELADSESSVEDVIKDAVKGLDATLITDSTLNSGYHLKNTSAYVTENVKTEIVEKETVKTLFADDFVEGDLRRIAVTVLSDGQLYYEDKDNKEIILGNVKKENHQAFVVGSSAREICVRYNDGEVEKTKIDDSKNEYKFIYSDACYFEVRGKSPFELYIDGVYYGASGKKKESRIKNNSTKQYYIFAGSEIYDLSEGEHEILLLYNNRYYEKGTIELLKRRYSSVTTIQSFNYYDGGNSSARFSYSFFNPLLGVGSMVQGDVAGSSIVFLGEMIGGAAIYLGYDIQKSWLEKATADGYSVEQLDNTIPKVIIYTGVGIAATSLLVGLIKPYTFKKRVPKKNNFDYSEEKEDISLGMFITSNNNLALGLEVHF